MSLNSYVIDDVVVFLKSRQIRWNSVLWKPSTPFPILAPSIQKSKTFQFLKRDTSHILFPKEHIWQKYFAGNFLLAGEPWTLYLVHLNLSPHLDTCSHPSLLYREPHNLPVGFSDHSTSSEGAGPSRVLLQEFETVQSVAAELKGYKLRPETLWVTWSWSWT